VTSKWRLCVSRGPAQRFDPQSGSVSEFDEHFYPFSGRTNFLKLPPDSRQTQARQALQQLANVVQPTCRRGLDPLRAVQMRLFKWAAALLCFLLATVLQAQTVQVQRSGDNPIYKITVQVVERSTTAVNYRHRGGSTRLDFRGTPLLPNAHGEVEVEGQKGYMQIKTELKDMQPAWRFGSEYLTYVLWAITPEGRPVNLGEVILNDDGRGGLDVTTDLQAFGMIVTAEPYFGVTQPSDVGRPRKHHQARYERHHRTGQCQI
jgi:hypothetical protein